MKWIEDVKIDFMGKSKIAITFSIVLILIGMISLIIKGGPALGIDFSGGVLVQLKFSKPISIGEIRKTLKKIDMGESDIQEFGSPHHIIINTAASPGKTDEIGSKIKGILSEEYRGVDIEIERTEMVGAKVGRDLRQKALFAIYYSLLFMAVYVSGRFELKWGSSIGMAMILFLLISISTTFFPNINISLLIFVALAITMVFCTILHLKYAIGVIVSLFHDVLITLGAFSLTNREFSLPVLAAFLTLVGYSVNDTIVIFDRIRENLKGNRSPNIDVMTNIINDSISQTLSRTLLTSLTVLFVVLILFFFGGEVIHDFAFALLVGVIAGSYSTIFIASPILVIWESWVMPIIPDMVKIK